MLAASVAAPPASSASLLYRVGGGRHLVGADADANADADDTLMTTPTNVDGVGLSGSTQEHRAPDTAATAVDGRSRSDGVRGTAPTSAATTGGRVRVGVVK